MCFFCFFLGLIQTSTDPFDLPELSGGSRVSWAETSIASVRLTGPHLPGP